MLFVIVARGVVRADACRMAGNYFPSNGDNDSQICAYFHKQASESKGKFKNNQYGME